jgi:hypothetical protein
MAKETTPTFVLKMKMHTNVQIEKRIEDELEINRVIYNTCLGELLKREKNMKRTKRHKQLLRQYRAISKKLADAESRKDKDAVRFYTAEKKEVNKKFAELRTEFGLTEYSIHAYVTPIRAHFGNRVNVNVAQKTATRAWGTFQETMFGSANKVAFKRKGEMESFEGKTNGTGWTYRTRKIKCGKQFVELKIKPNDVYLREALHWIDSGQTYDYRTAKGKVKQDVYRVKYVRIHREFIRGKYVYFAHLVCAGYPPVKKDKDGRIKHRLGKGKVGIDIGTSSVAVVSQENALLRNLGEEIKRIDDTERKIRLAQRAMDRSKRAMNPTNYRMDGTIKAGKKRWVYSKRYMKLRYQLKSLYRKLAVLRKLSHQRMSNQLMTLGDDFFIEEMNFKALQKRAKETVISEKTGRNKRKKRFGKSIAHRAPALFVSLLKDKVLANKGEFTKVNTRTFKASQYDHTTGECVKKELKERWHRFADGTRIQRDLYSAFLLMNSEKNGEKANQESCSGTFETFLHFHNQEIERIEQQEMLVSNSGVQLKNKKTAFAV